MHQNDPKDKHSFLHTRECCTDTTRTAIWKCVIIMLFVQWPDILYQCHSIHCRKYHERQWLRLQMTRDIIQFPCVCAECKYSHSETLGLLVRMYCTNAVPKSFCAAKPKPGATHDSLLSSWEDLFPAMLNCFTFFKQVLRILLPRNDVKWFGGYASFRLKFFFSPTEMEMVSWYSYEALGHSTSERQVLDPEEL